MKRLHHIILITAAALLTVVAAVSCSSSKEPGTSQGYQPKAPKEIRELATQLAAADATPWQTLTVPVNLSIKNSGMPSVGGTMTMTRNEEIRISLRFLGMEMGALCARRDSVFAYIKLQRIYLAESTTELLKGYPATVGNLQDLILGRLFEIGKARPTVGGMDLRRESDSRYIISPRTAAKGLEYAFNVDIPANRLASTGFRHSGINATVDYSDAGAAVPPVKSQTVTVSTNAGGRNLAADLTVNYSKAKWDKGLTDKPFSIPNGYRRISASALLKALGEEK